MSFSILSFLKQATLLLSQSQRMVGMNIRITACEAAFESLLQLSLQLYIIFLRSDTFPSALQVDLTALWKISKILFPRSSPSSPRSSWCLSEHLRTSWHPWWTRRRSRIMTLSTTLPSAFTQEAKNWVIFAIGQLTPFSPFSAMPAILHLSHHLPGNVLQPGSGGCGGVLLHRPLLCSSLNSPEWNFPLDVVGWGECSRPGKPLKDPAAARPRLFVHASFQDYP